MAEVTPPVVGGILPTVKADPSAPDVQLQATPLAAQGTEKMGQAVLGVGKFFGQLQTTDVMNQADTQAQSLMAHYATLQGQDALNAAPVVQQKIQDIYKQARGQLGSLDQMNQFDQGMSENIRTYGRQISEQAHEGSVEYARATIQSSSDIADNGAAQAAQIANPDGSLAAFTGYLNKSVSAATKGAQIEGNAGDTNVLQDVQNQARSRTAFTYIKARADYSPQAGLDAYTKLNGLLNPADRAQLQAYTQGKIMPVIARQLAAPIVGAVGGTKIAPGQDGSYTLTPAQFDTQWGAESNNSQFGPDGKVLTSSMGAQGIAQLMPATAQATAKANGIAWNPDQFANDPAYNQKLGELTMNGYLKQTGGNWDLSLAMYNAGPNGKGVAHYAATGDMSQLLQQTQDYIQKIDPGATDMQTQIAQLTATLQARYPNDPQGAAAAAESAIVNQTYLRSHEQAVASQQQKTQSEAFVNQSATLIWQSQDPGGKPLPANFIETIDNNPTLTAPQKDSLRQMALKSLGEENIGTYGQGYTAALSAITAPYGTAGKIETGQQVIDLYNQGKLTAPGMKELLGTLNSVHTAQGTGAAAAKASMLSHLRSMVTFDGEPGAFPGMPALRDPNGEANYDTKAVPMFEKAYSAWQAAGKDPMDFPVENLQKIADTLATPAQVRARKLAADGGMAPDGTQAPPADQPKPPPPPAGVKSPDAWTHYAGDLPQIQGGTFPAAKWYQALSYLAAHPQPATVDQFNAIFGKYGYSGQDIVNELMTAPINMAEALPPVVNP